MIELSQAARQPDTAQLQALLQPVATEIMAAEEMAAQRRSDFFQHNKSVAEAMAALSWLAYTKPACGALCVWGEGGQRGGLAWHESKELHEP